MVDLLLKFSVDIYCSVVCMNFCRVVLTTSSEWGAMVTKLSVPADWKGASSHSYIVLVFVNAHTMIISCYV